MKLKTESGRTDNCTEPQQKQQKHCLGTVSNKLAGAALGVGVVVVVVVVVVGGA